MADTSAPPTAGGTGRKHGRRVSKVSRASLRIPLPTNTYRLYPKHQFEPNCVYRVLEKKTRPLFESIYEYDFQDMAILCKNVNVEALRAINGLYWPSYKIVVVVQCLEKADYTCRGSIRYYWNPKFDGLVTYNYENDNYIVIVTAAFFYYE